MVSHDVKLNALIIINMQVLSLGGSKQLMVVQEGHISYSFLSLKLAE